MRAFMPATLLVLLAVFVPEAATGSTPLSVIFTPPAFLILFAGYGLAVLVLREFSVRMHLGIGGLLLLGVAYGFINEGLFAKTLLRETALPMAEYDGYSYMLGINLAFTLAITIWHAVSSFMFPVLAAHVFFPEARGNPWLGKKTTAALALLVLAIALLLHFDATNAAYPAGTWGSACSFLALIGLLTWAATRFRSESAAVATRPSLGPVWLGLSTFVFLFLILTEFIAGEKMPFFLFALVYVFGVLLYIRTLRKHGWLSNEALLLFTVGCYLDVIVMGFILAFQGPMPVERLATEIIFLVGAVWILRKVLRRAEHS